MGRGKAEEMDRSIVPDVGWIMRLQITSRLRASAAKLTNQRSIVAPVQFVRASLEWQP